MFCCWGPWPHAATCVGCHQPLQGAVLDVTACLSGRARWRCVGSSSTQSAFVQVPLCSGTHGVPVLYGRLLSDLWCSCCMYDAVGDVLAHSDIVMRAIKGFVWGQVRSPPSTAVLPVVQRTHLSRERVARAVVMRGC